MALTKEFEYDCEVRGPYKAEQVRVATLTMMVTTRSAVPIGTSCNAAQVWRHMGDTDIRRGCSVQAVCNAVWTSTVKSAYENFADAQDV